MNADREFLQECIIDSTSDDYENFAMISQEIASWAVKEHKVFSEDGLVDALEAMIEQKRVRAYKFDVIENKFVSSNFNLIDLPNLWFFSKQ